MSGDSQLPTFEELVSDPRTGLDPNCELIPLSSRGVMPTPITVRLCDDAGLISDERVGPGSPGTTFDPELTYRKLLNNLRAATGEVPYVGVAFRCTGSAHLAGQVFRCTSEAHRRKVGQSSG